MADSSPARAERRMTGSVAVRGSIEFENRGEQVRLRNIYASDGSSAMTAAISTATPLAYLMQGGFDALKIKRVSLVYFDQGPANEIVINNFKKALGGTGT